MGSENRPERAASANPSFPNQFRIYYQSIFKNAFLNLQILEPDYSIQDIAIDAEGRLMAAVNNRGHCYVWSLSEGVGEKPTKLIPKHKYSAHAKYALRCQFSPDSRSNIINKSSTVYIIHLSLTNLTIFSLLVTTSGDGTARVWSMHDFSLVKELTHTSQRWVWDAAFSADSQYVFTGKCSFYMILIHHGHLKMDVFLQVLLMEMLGYGMFPMVLLKERIRVTKKL